MPTLLSPDSAAMTTRNVNPSNLSSCTFGLSRTIWTTLGTVLLAHASPASRQTLATKKWQARTPQFTSEAEREPSLSGRINVARVSRHRFVVRPLVFREHEK